MRHLLVLFRIAASAAKGFINRLRWFQNPFLKTSEVWWYAPVIPVLGGERGRRGAALNSKPAWFTTKR